MIKPGENNPPNAELELEYIYGYRCHDTRNNIQFIPSGEIVYHAAAVGICLEPESNSQRFSFDHNDDIICLASYRSIVATG